MKIYLDFEIVPPEGVIDDSHETELLQAILNKLVELDEEFLETCPMLPAVYKSGVRYEPSYMGAYKDIRTILRQGYAEVDSLASWRCAELRLQGEDAHPVIVKVTKPDGGIVYTVRVKRGDGSIEDVVEMLKK